MNTTITNQCSNYVSRLCNRESSALLLPGGKVKLFGGHEPIFSEDNCFLITRTGGEVLSALDHEVVKQACIGNSHNLFLTTTNKVYVSGSNQFGQLGVPNSVLKGQDSIVELDTSFLEGGVIRQIDTGIAGGSAILTEEGKIFTAGEASGRNPISAAVTEERDGRGRGEGEGKTGGFEAIPAESFDGEPVVFMSHGGCVSVYITSSGAVYVTGSNWNYEASGMLGLGDRDDANANVPLHQHTPVRLDTLWNMGVRAVTGCAGRLWTVVVDTEGRMFGWGCNRSGQLGLGTQVQDQHVPVLIPISATSIGGAASGAKDERMSINEGLSGSEGSGGDGSEGAVPVRVVQVSCSWVHTLALTSTGEVYSFGSNSVGQLGRDTGTDTGTNTRMVIDLVSDDGSGAEASHTCSHAVPGLMDLSRLVMPPPPLSHSCLSGNPTQQQQRQGKQEHQDQQERQEQEQGKLEMQFPVVVSVHAGMGHSLLEVQQGGADGVYASCGMARHGQLGSWDQLEEVKTSEVHFNLCRMAPVVIDLEGGGIGAENIGSVVCVPAAPVPSRGKRRRRGWQDEEDEEDEEEEEEEEEEDDWEEDVADDSVFLTLDYASLPLEEQGIVATSFSSLAERVLGHNDFPVADEDDATPVHLCIANHYGPVDIEQFIDCLRHPVFQSAMKLKFRGLIFVSCTLMVTTPSHIEAFADALALYPNFASFTMDLSSLYTVGSRALENGNSDDRLLGQFYSSLIRKVTSLHNLSVEDLGKTGIANVCEACVWRDTTAQIGSSGSSGSSSSSSGSSSSSSGCSSSGSSSGGGSETATSRKVGQAASPPSLPPPDVSLALEVRGASFSLPGFQLLASVLSSTSVLTALCLPEHEHLTAAAVDVLAASLSTCCSLHTLDLHVTELGHRGVQQRGVEAIVTALESNSSSKLCKLDVSGDDGEPAIGKKLQKRLTKSLVRNSKDNFQGKYLKFAKLQVYCCHENE